MGHVTEALWWTCRLHQFEMYEIPQYVVKLVINPKIFSPVSRQPALTWQAVCTQFFLCADQMLAPSVKSMKRIQSPILSYGKFQLYTLCGTVTLTFDLISPKLGHVTGILCWIYPSIWKFIGLFVFEICGLKMLILWPCC